jgi:integrase
MRLTARNVAMLPLPSGKSEHVEWDDTLAGFGVRIRQGGKRTWVAQYRVHGKTQKATLGTVEAVHIDEARQEARNILAKVQLGGNPRAEKAMARASASVTFEAVSRLYLERCAKRTLKPRSYDEVERYLTKHWAPLAATSIEALHRRVVAARLGEIAVANGPFAANRARAALSALFTWAMGEGLAEGNPTIGTNRATDETKRDRVLSEAELVEVWQACRADDYGRIVRLLILTGQRRDEVGGLGWSEVTESKAFWCIPAARTKNGLPHDVPLSPQALLILSEISKRDRRDLLFGDGIGGFQGWSKAKNALDARILASRSFGNGNLVSWRLHDIRRTVVTGMNNLGVQPHVVEAVVNHITGPSRQGVAGVYNRAIYAAEKREALDRWAAHVETLAVVKERTREPSFTGAAC